MSTVKKQFKSSTKYIAYGASIDTRKFLSFNVWPSITSKPFTIKAVSLAKAHNMVRMYHKISPFKIEPVLC